MVAHQLNGSNEEALEVYDAMVEATNKDGATPQEQSQIALNVVNLCMNMGDHEEGLRRLDKAFYVKVLSPRGEASQLRGELYWKDRWV